MLTKPVAVPFTYSAEAYVCLNLRANSNRSLTNTQQPLEVRDVGMSFATAVCWGFNALLALTFPAMSRAFGIGGAFYFYAAWNVVGFLYTYFFLPETKKLTLEMLDERFRVSLWQFARLNYYSLPWNRNRILLPKDLEDVRDTMTREYEDVDNTAAREEDGGLRRVLCCFGRKRPVGAVSAPDPTQLVMSRVLSRSPDEMSVMSEKEAPVEHRSLRRQGRVFTPYPGKGM